MAEKEKTAPCVSTAIGTDLKPNVLTLKLNVTAGRLLNEYNITYATSRTHSGRNVTLKLKQKQELKSFRTLEELRKVKNELNSLKMRFQKVLDFVESMKLTQKLQEFLKTFTKRYQM